MAQFSSSEYSLYRNDLKNMYYKYVQKNWYIKYGHFVNIAYLCSMQKKEIFTYEQPTYIDEDEKDEFTSFVCDVELTKDKLVKYCNKHCLNLFINPYTTAIICRSLLNKKKIKL